MTTAPSRRCGVTQGVATADSVQITKGLQVGERVITEGGDRLKDGAKVALPGDAASGPRRGASGASGAWGGHRRHEGGAASAPADGASARPPPSRRRQRPGRRGLVGARRRLELAAAPPRERHAIVMRPMSPSRPFIQRPVATSLLMLAIVLTGIVGFRFLPLSALPQVDYPTIQVQTLYPGGSPEVMSRTVTAPLEKQFGNMSGLARMGSTSAAGVSLVTLQFNLGLSLDVAEQEVQAAINAGNSLLPADLPAPPVYAKVNPADAPVLTLAVSSKTMPLPDVQNLVNTRLAQKISQVSGVGLVTLAGGQRPAMRIQADTRAMASYGIDLSAVKSAITSANANSAKGSFDGASRSYAINANDQLVSVDDYRNLIVSYKNGAPVRLTDIAQVVDSAENLRLAAWADDTPAIIVNVQRQPGANVIQTVDAIKKQLPALQAGAARRRSTCASSATAPRASARRWSTWSSSWCWPSCW